MLKRCIKFYVPVIVGGFLIILLSTFLLRFTNKTVLNGVTLTEYPKNILFQHFYNGNFQNSFEEWLRDNFFGQPFIVKCHNQIEYGIFKDGIGDWIQGREGYLYSREQTFSYTGGEGADKTTDEQYENYVESVYQLQESLQKKGKNFFVLISPTKAEVYPEYLPWNERILLNHYKDSQGSKQKLISLFEKYGVNYYDTTNDLISMRKNVKYDVFSKTGHHWTLTATANEMNSVFQNMSYKTPGIEYPMLSVTGITDEVYNTDKDILYLQNTIFPVYSDKYNKPVVEYSNTSKDKVYLFGTSFGWEVMDSLYQNGVKKAFDTVIYQQYFTHSTRYNEDGIVQNLYTQENAPADLGIMEGIKDSNLIIMEQPGIFGVTDTHQKFVDYVNENIDNMYYSLGLDVATATADIAAVEFDGFWPVESWGRWAQEKEASVIFDGNSLQNCESEMALYLNAVSYGQEQEIQVFLNDEWIGTYIMGLSWNDYMIPLPQEKLLPNRNKIMFQMSKDLISPESIGEDGGNRKLGLGFQSIYIDRAD